MLKWSSSSRQRGAEGPKGGQESRTHWVMYLYKIHVSGLIKIDHFEWKKLKHLAMKALCAKVEGLHIEISASWKYTARDKKKRSIWREGLKWSHSTNRESNSRRRSSYWAHKSRDWQLFISHCKAKTENWCCPDTQVWPHAGIFFNTSTHRICTKEHQIM